MILLFCFIILPPFFQLFGYKIHEGLCNSKCDVSDNDCSGSDLSNCLIGKKSITCPVPAPIKCIADFGTSVGDSLCCGQKGVLQNTKYVCPNTLKKCNNFKCGSAFGTCV